ncbi:MAG: hypothetical protein EAY76_02710 [Alphaproteobacteria bacterium]|nr:MAG: hypothetical protein EAY76_02710 [Alphaproteobacteria bacterium]TAF41477.1 MAG: hypothetical protein EAZ66_01335 [Alphaproteobacteria bacterium]TAF75727.1 MAG: hypothetical protein EAZ52_06060 [Alphaproteobacteria bacterium]
MVGEVIKLFETLMLIGAFLAIGTSFFAILILDAYRLVRIYLPMYVLFITPLLMFTIAPLSLCMNCFFSPKDVAGFLLSVACAVAMIAYMFRALLRAAIKKQPPHIEPESPLLSHMRSMAYGLSAGLILTLMFWQIAAGQNSLWQSLVVVTFPLLVIIMKYAFRCITYHRLVSLEMFFVGYLIAFGAWMGYWGYVGFTMYQQMQNISHPYCMVRQGDQPVTIMDINGLRLLHGGMHAQLYQQEGDDVFMYHWSYRKIAFHRTSSDPLKKDTLIPCIMVKNFL